MCSSGSQIWKCSPAVERMDPCGAIIVEDWHWMPLFSSFMLHSFYPNHSGHSLNIWRTWFQSLKAPRPFSLNYQIGCTLSNQLSVSITFIKMLLPISTGKIINVHIKHRTKKKKIVMFSNCFKLKLQLLHNKVSRMKCELPYSRSIENSILHSV